MRLVRVHHAKRYAGRSCSVSLRLGGGDRGRVVRVDYAARSRQAACDR